MCITNNFSETTLKQIRKLEVQSEEMSDRELAEVLVRIKKIKDDLEWGAEKAIKKLQERNFNSVELFPELESKVYLAEGRSVSNINSAGFILDMKKAGLEGMIPDCVSIVKSKVEALENETALQALEANTFKSIGEPSIAVRKMSKKELKEAL